MSESLEQQAFITWFEYHFPKLKHLLFHIPNGGYRNKFEASRLKKEGVRAGIPDLFFALPVSAYHGLFIEMKSSTGRLTKPQAFYFKELKNNGYIVECCHGWDKASKVIADYMAGWYG